MSRFKTDTKNLKTADWNREGQQHRLADSHLSFANDRQELLWLQEQNRLLWEFLDNENLSEEADEYVKKNGGAMADWAT